MISADPLPLLGTPAMVLPAYSMEKWMVICSLQWWEQILPDGCVGLLESWWVATFIMHTPVRHRTNTGHFSVECHCGPMPGGYARHTDQQYLRPQLISYYLAAISGSSRVYIIPPGLSLAPYCLCYVMHSTDSSTVSLICMFTRSLIKHKWDGLDYRFSMLNQQQWPWLSCTSKVRERGMTFCNRIFAYPIAGWHNKIGK